MAKEKILSYSVAFVYCMHSSLVLFVVILLMLYDMLMYMYVAHFVTSCCHPV